MSDEPKRIGRPSKFTAERAERIMQMIKSGAYGHVAARANGISTATFHAWQAKGRDAEKDPDTGLCIDPDLQQFADFSDDVKNAEAEAEVRNIALIQTAARGGTWQAAAWYLERRYSDRWGRKDHLKQEVSGPEGGPVEVDAKAELLSFLTTRREEASDGTDPVVAAEAATEGADHGGTDGGVA
jgi:hypothetical protein